MNRNDFILILDNKYGKPVMQLWPCTVGPRRRLLKIFADTTDDADTLTSRSRA